MNANRFIWKKREYRWVTVSEDIRSLRMIVECENGRFPPSAFFDAHYKPRGPVRISAFLAGGKRTFENGLAFRLLSDFKKISGRHFNCSKFDSKVFFTTDFSKKPLSISKGEIYGN